MSGATLEVLMVSSSYPSDEADWRGIFIRNLTWALSRQTQLRLTTWCPPGPMPANVRYAATPSESRWLEGLARGGGIAHAIRQSPVKGALQGLGLMRRIRAVYGRESQAELVHANWLQLALPLGRRGCPLVATVLGTDYRMLALPGMVSALRRVFGSGPTVLAPNAEWMAPGLSRHFGDVARIIPVPFGIEEAYFAIARRPASPPAWLCVSRLTKAKLGDLLTWARPHFEGQARELHLFGPMQESLILPDWIHYHGPATQAQLLRDWFPVASGLISLSRHPEGRPQVMIEAMAAGLPILASDLPAHVELIEPHGAGAICRNPEELGTLLGALESDEGLRAGALAREAARRMYGTWDDCAGRFAAIYRDLSVQRAAHSAR